METTQGGSSFIEPIATDSVAWKTTSRNPMVQEVARRLIADPTQALKVRFTEFGYSNFNAAQSALRRAIEKNGRKCQVKDLGDGYAAVRVLPQPEGGAA